MKGIAELAIMALIGTVTIMASIVLPPAIIRSTIDKETFFTYDFEKSQNALIALFSLEKNGKTFYEQAGTSLVLNKPVTSPLKSDFDKLVGTTYCISEIKSSPLPTGAIIGIPPSSKIISDVCQNFDVEFNTIISVPYNKVSLVKVIGIGSK